ncbi:MAG: BrnA antitoxin family protein [Gemmatimonadales bacterium]|nr:BrnA antitoxin family protein [Gemmatimonadales bacterium]
MPKRAKPSRRIPSFKSEAQERAFWATHDSTDYLDWKRAQRVRLPTLAPSTATISVRLPQAMLEELKQRANEQDVPYQSLLKVYLAERLSQERTRRRSRKVDA